MMKEELIKQANKQAASMALDAILSTQKDPMDMVKENREYESDNAEWQADAYVDAIWGR